MESSWSHYVFLQVGETNLRVRYKTLGLFAPRSIWLDCGLEEGEMVHCNPHNLQLIHLCVLFIPPSREILPNKRHDGVVDYIRQNERIYLWKLLSNTHTKIPQAHSKYLVIWQMQIMKFNSSWGSVYFLRGRFISFSIEDDKCQLACNIRLQGRAAA